jgi:hypothetical protein
MWLAERGDNRPLEKFCSYNNAQKKRLHVLLQSEEYYWIGELAH